MNMHRKYDIWKNCNLNSIPIIGRPPIEDIKLCSIILSLNDFSFSQIKNYYENSEEHIKYTIKKYLKLGYLHKYESNNKYNAYRYKITDAGKSYFTKISNEL